MFAQRTIIPVIITAMSLIASITNALVDDDSLRYRSLAAMRADAPLAHAMGSVLNFNGVSSPDPAHRRILRDRKGSKGKGQKRPKGAGKPCNPEKVDLSEFPQWRAEVGYWVGEYTFYQSTGKPFTSANWNYRYDDYSGFITGNIEGNAYRQRNVFLYPPQFTETCEGQDDSSRGIVGEGTCGVNGNTKVFFADQSVETCSNNPETAGDLSGPFAGGVFSTTTELIGADNALLYQVFLNIPNGPPVLFQSQLTTLSIDGVTGAQRRTRSAQSFANGLPRSLSFFREVKVSKEEFYEQLQNTLQEYNVLESDTCAWIDSTQPPPFVVPSVYTPGIEGCMEHLEQSFDL